MKWAFFQRSSGKFKFVFEKEHDEAMDVVTDYVRSGFKVSIDGREAFKLELDEDVFLVGVISMKTKHEVMYRTQEHTEMPIIWLLDNMNKLSTGFLPVSDIWDDFLEN